MQLHAINAITATNAFHATNLGRHSGSQTARARAPHANSCSHGARARAICEPLRRQTVDSTAPLST
eukprot:3089025-Lingulodinium_polyedra.AAC.1